MYPKLGRHVEHDPRSLSFQVAPTVAPKSVHWTRRCPVFDQGQLGSCTGNASAGVLGTDWLHGQGNPNLTEADALKIYELGTTLDKIPGHYPPDDTGSSGLAVAKACQRLGLILSYHHALGVKALLSALQSGPVIVGTSWHEGMFKPDAQGFVTVSGDVVGGHEYECIGADIENGVLEFVNSWGSAWGHAGYFFMKIAVFDALLRDQGDCTQFNRKA